MNCKVCGAPLQQNARFCPNCGTPTDQPTPENGAEARPVVPPSSAPPDNTVHVQPQQSSQPPMYDPQQAPPWAPTQPAGPPQGAPPWVPTQTVTHESQAGPPMSSFQPPAPLPYYQGTTSNRGANMPPTTYDRQARGPRRERNRAGCVLGCLTVLVILLLVAGAGWLFLLRPYLHNIAATQIDKALSSGVQQIPTTLPTVPAGVGAVPIPIRDNTINNLFVLNLAPNNPIKNPETQITPDSIHMSFQLYGFSNGISLKPAVQGGRLVATNVGISGPFSLIMSPDELTPLLNRHLSDAQNRIKHQIQDIQLKDHEMDLTLGPAQTP
ncbi:MAG: zinc-ribbon domain-containing protein [Ktedonobacteraceae bacterium]|nr:zinc-ribbon domain-containing protein [Ktedonobacteraceae bacterium]